MFEWNMLSGIVPLRLLSSKKAVSSVERLPKDNGKVPDKLLAWRSK
jgi:hypothetical protein